MTDLTTEELSNPQTPTATTTLMPPTPVTKSRTAAFRALNVPKLQLPPTPNATPMKGTKRALPTSAPSSPLAERSTLHVDVKIDDNAPRSSPIEPPVKRLRRVRYGCQNPRYNVINTVERGPVRIYQKRFASLELKRLANELMYQVDWEEMEEYVACNRPGMVYRNLVRNMLLKRARKLEAQEAEMVESSTDEDEDDEEEEKEDMLLSEFV